MKPDWEKEAEDYTTGLPFARPAQQFFKDGCDHGYGTAIETLVKPLQEENELLRIRHDKTEARFSKANKENGGLHGKLESLGAEIAALKEKIEILNDIDLQNIVNEQQSDLEASYSEVQRLQEQIAALKEENEHFHKLYIQKLNENVNLRAQLDSIK